MTNQQAMAWATARLSSPSAYLDAEVLLAYVWRRQRAWLKANPDLKLSWRQEIAFRCLINKRRRGWPVAYLKGAKEFWGLNFKINRHVLIPRPETETIVDEVIQLAGINNFSKKIMIDLGTGCGCVAIALAKELPDFKIIATDISHSALHLARHNAKIHRLADRITFMRGNLLKPILTTNRELLSQSLIVANLPYLKPDEITAELKFEPRVALVGGRDGLKYYQELSKQISELKSRDKPNIIILELHPPTAIEVQKIFSHTLPSADIQIKTDLSNRPRLAIIRL